MPRPLLADWPLIQALFLQGFSDRQISERTGVKPVTIRARAARHGWCIMRDRANGAFVTNPDSLAHPGLSALVQSQSKSLIKASQIAQEAFAGELQDQVAVLKRKPPTKLLDLANTPRREGRASVVQKLVNTASKLYGWDQQTTAPQAMNLTQINVTSPSERPAGAKVIDVPYEP